VALFSSTLPYVCIIPCVSYYDKPTTCIKIKIYLLCTSYLTGDSRHTVGTSLL
jgi:hypothetical protein